MISGSHTCVFSLNPHPKQHYPVSAWAATQNTTDGVARTTDTSPVLVAGARDRAPAGLVSGEDSSLLADGDLLAGSSRSGVGARENTLWCLALIGQESHHEGLPHTKSYAAGGSPVPQAFVDSPRSARAAMRCFTFSRV